MHSRYQSRIFHVSVDLLLSVAVVQIVLAPLLRNHPISDFLVTANYRMFVGSYALVMIFLMSSWRPLNYYLNKYRATWGLKARPFLLVDDLVIMLIAASVLSLVLKTPRYVSHTASYNWFAFAASISILTWLISAYYRKAGAGASANDIEVKSSNLSDESITTPEQDVLNRSGFVNRLTEDITKLPFKDSFVFAINGKWGEGKSSVINLLRLKMKEQETFFVVDYTPWYYESHDALLSSFYGLIERSIGRQFIIPNLKKTIIRYQQVIKNGIGMTGLKFSFSLKEQSPVELKSLIEKYLDTTGKKVLVIVDELDRLQTEELMFVLQLIRLNTNLKNTVFLLAYDQQIIKEVLPEPYNKDNRYLEKIVQKTVPLPAIQQSTIDKYIDENLSQIFDTLNVSKARLDKFTKDFPYLYQTEFTAFLRTLRNAKQFLNNISSTLPAIIDEVDLKDFMIIELIHMVAPNLYDDIWEHPWYYIPTDWSFFSFPGAPGRYSFRDDSSKYPDMKKHIESVLSKETEQDGLRELLEEVFFVEVKNALSNGVTGHDQVASKYRKEQRLTHPDIFTKYFLGQVPEDELPDKVYAQIIKDWKSAGNSAQRRAAIQKTFRDMKPKNKLSELLKKLKTFFGEDDKAIAKDLIITIADNIELFSIESTADLWRSDFQQALAVMLRILDEQIPTQNIQKILKSIVTKSNNLIFITNVITWCQARNSSSLSNVTSNADINILKGIVAAKLDAKFITTKADIFEKYPKVNDWGHLLYQWSTDWQTASSPLDKVSGYLAEVFISHPASFKIFLNAYLVPERDRSDRMLQDFRLDEVNKGYNIVKFRDAAKQIIEADQVSPRFKKMLNRFVEMADKAIANSQTSAVAQESSSQDEEVT